MNVSDFSYLIYNPYIINEQNVSDLESILVEFPYFQSARSIQLKGLQIQNSFKYNSALKKAAAFTIDRNVLFNFITSENFKIIPQNKTENESTAIINNEEALKNNGVVESLHTKENISEENRIENTLEKSIISSINEATSNLEDDEEMKKSWLEDKIEDNQPEQEDLVENQINPIDVAPETSVEFSTHQTHSFQEWLQLSKLNPIDRKEARTKEENEALLATKYEIIDKFIDANPKITPPKEDAKPQNLIVKKEDTSYLMTETLAKIYLEQKKYSKAIQAYEILILKYPEKSSLFADRILEIKESQQNNNS